MGTGASIDNAVALSYLGGNSNYGVSIEVNDSTSVPYPVIGIFDRQGFIEGNDFVNNRVPIILIHEFMHPHINPLILSHINNLKASGEVIFPLIEEQMRRQAYGSWENVLFEALVRASVIHYMKTHDVFKGMVDKQIEYEISRGFGWVGSLAKKLEEYEADRQRYPDLGSFMPQIVGFYDDLAERTRNRHNPLER